MRRRGQVIAFVIIEAVLVAISDFLINIAANSFMVPLRVALLLLVPAIVLGIGLAVWRSLKAEVKPAASSSGPQAPGGSRLTVTLARELDLTSFKLGDNTAATFDYLTAPVQAAYDAATHALREASTGTGSKRGILVLGEANAGKTRLALEALIQTLPDWPVLRWNEAYTAADIPAEDALPNHGLVVFIDDLPNYAPLAQRINGRRILALASSPAAALRALLESMPARARPVVIVATCRAEEEERTRAELGWLFTQLAPIRLPEFSTDARNPAAQQIIAAFKAHGTTHAEDWDGTLGSLVLGLSTKQDEYKALKVQNSPAVPVLWAMKLLTQAGTFEHTERRLRAVCGDVFGEHAIEKEERTWQAAVADLTRLQFVTEAVSADGRQVTLVIRKDTYFDQVVTDYLDPQDPQRPQRLMQYLIRLQAVFVALGDGAGLRSLGNALARLGRYEEALAAYDHALALDPNYANAWHNKANSLRALGREAEAQEAERRAKELGG